MCEYLLLNGNKNECNLLLPLSTTDVIVIEDFASDKHLLVLHDCSLSVIDLPLSDSVPAKSNDDPQCRMVIDCNTLLKPFVPFVGIDVELISYAYNTLCCLTCDRRVLIYGQSKFGQCGVIEDYVLTPSEIKFQDIVLPQSVLNLTCTASSCFALTNDGFLWTWGKVFEDDPSPDQRQFSICVEPVLINSLNGRRVIAIACGEAHCIALAETLYTKDNYCLSEPTVASTPHNIKSPMFNKIRRTSPSKFYVDLESDALENDSGVTLGFLSLSVNSSPEHTEFLETNKANDSINIEMKEIKAPLDVNWRKKGKPDAVSRFSFVSDLELNADENSSCSSSDDSIISSWCILPEDNFFPKSIWDHRAGKSNSDLLYTEIWTWGENSSGQLGQGDTDFRAFPTLLKNLRCHRIIKVSAGGFHSAALSASGQIFVFGSNRFGQIKMANAKIQPVPCKVKLGNKTVAYDMSAGSDFTLILVSSHHFLPDLYYWGKNYADTNTPQPIALRLGDMHKAGIICRSSASSCSGYLILRIHHSLSFLSQLYTLLFNQIYFLNVLIELFNFLDEFAKSFKESHSTDIEQRLLAQSTRTWRCFLNTVIDQTSFLRHHLLQHSKNCFEFCGHHSSDFNLICENGTVDLLSFLPFVSCSSFLALYRNFVRCTCCLIASGLFKEAVLGPHVDILFKQFQQICSRHDLDASRPHRALRHMMHIPFKYLSLLTELKLFAKNSKQLEDIIYKWEKLDHWSKKEISLAECTYKFWASNELLTNDLLSHGRLLIAEFTKNTDFQYVQLDGYKCACHRILIFSDVCALLQGNSNLLFPVVLMWTPQQEYSVMPEVNKSKPTLQISCPESKIVVYFSDGVKKNEFYQALDSAVKHCELYASDLPLACVSGPTLLRRKAKYIFSAKHLTYPNATYSGTWLNAVPHGSGEMIWTDGRRYVGKFSEGFMHGFGELHAVSRNGENVVHGCWTNGLLNGLALIDYANGSRYEGWIKDGERCGFGVLSQPGSTYYGSWKCDLRDGYGVFDNGTREKYMGLWEYNSCHGTGVFITIEGHYYEGQFDGGKLIKGSLIFPDGTRYEGAFNGTEEFAGKGAMFYINGDSVKGTFNGKLQQEIKVVGILTKSTHSPLCQRNTFCEAISLCDPLMGVSGLNNSSFEHSLSYIQLSADLKWCDIFAQFFKEIRLPDIFSLATVELLPATVWDGIACAIDRSRRRQNKHSAAVVDSMQIVPNFDGPFSKDYFNMVKNYWAHATTVSVHPLRRLLCGLADVISNAYSGVGVHNLLLPHILAELRSVAQRLYSVLRLLFPSLPFVDDLEECPLRFEEDCESETHLLESARQFVVDTLISRIYPVLFTLYVQRCSEYDRRYWAHLNIVNTRDDVQLVEFLEVDRCWLDIIKADSTKRCFSDAIECFQELSSEFTPFGKLKIIFDTFTKVTKHLSKGRSQWDMDLLCPAMLWAVVRSEIRHLGAELRMTHDLIPYLSRINGGELEMMLTTLKACYFQLAQEKFIKGRI